MCERIVRSGLPRTGIGTGHLPEGLALSYRSGQVGATYGGSVRRAALALTAPLVLGAALLAAPASAGDDHYITVRALDDRFEVVGQTCAGDPGDLPDVRIGASDLTWRGRGSARVTAAPETTGGLLVRDPRPLHGAQYIVRATTGDAPTAQWRVEVDDDVLLSDPVHLERDAWLRVWLDDAVLHGPDGWTGSIDDYLAEFGKGDHWAAGLLTGPCLDSDEVRLDGIGARHDLYDFEPRTWTTVQVREDGPPYDGRLDAGDPFVVRGVAHRWDVRSDSAVRVPGADVVLQRRWSGPTTAWRTVTHAGTWHGTADRSASWRAVWHQPGGDVPSTEQLQTSWADASEPLVDGRRCRQDPDVLPFPPTCKTVRVGDTTTFSGAGSPPGAVRAEVTVRTGDFDGPVVEQHRTTVGRGGHWRISVDTSGHDRLYAEVTTSPTSSRHELGTHRVRFPLQAR